MTTAKTTTSGLPETIAQFIDATNTADTARFLDAFTTDATLDDWGRQFHGRDGIAAWNDTDNIGVQAHFELVKVAEVDAGHVYVVTLAVSGNGYNGTGPMTFTLVDGRIHSLVISP
jgi:ketosteroid isomerase-like protein